MEKGRRTGIKRQDLEHDGPVVRYVTFEGKQGVILDYDPLTSPEVLVLGFGGPHNLVLYGYFDGDDFMKVDQEYTG